MPSQTSDAIHALGAYLDANRDDVFPDGDTFRIYGPDQDGGTVRQLPCLLIRLDSNEQDLRRRSTYHVRLALELHTQADDTDAETAQAYGAHLEELLSAVSTIRAWIAALVSLRIYDYKLTGDSIFAEDRIRVRVWTVWLLIERTGAVGPVLPAPAVGQPVSVRQTPFAFLVDMGESESVSIPVSEGKWFYVAHVQFADDSGRRGGAIVTGLCVKSGGALTLHGETSTEMIGELADLGALTVDAESGELEIEALATLSSNLALHGSVAFYGYDE